jgi:hypothetical protein
MNRSQAPLDAEHHQVSAQPDHGRFRRRLKNIFRRNRRTHIASRSRRISRDALDGLPHEKFLRIVGWFHTMVPESSKQKDAQGIYVNPTAREFENLRAMIDKKLVENDLLFQHDEMGDHVHNLNLLLGKLLTVEALESAMPPIRDDYRARISPEAYAAYIGSPSYKALTGCNRTSDSATRLRLLQADYIQLINEVRKLTLLEYHIEETRSYLVKKLRRTLFKLLVAPAAIVLFFLLARVTMQAVNDLWPGPSGGNKFVVAFFGTDANHTTLYHALVLLTLLSLAAIVGAVGSFISALLRIEAVPETNEIARSVVALRYSESIRLAPLTGFVFAILLSFIFGGQLLDGTLFPSTAKIVPWHYVLFSATELSKWLVWAFIVGFAERLMPDMIDRLVARAGKTMQTAASPSQSNGNKPPLLPDAGAGTNGNGTHRLTSPAPRRRRRVRAQAS